MPSVSTTETKIESLVAENVESAKERNDEADLEVEKIFEKTQTTDQLSPDSEKPVPPLPTYLWEEVKRIKEQVS